jgi:hypothetical protein
MPKNTLKITIASITILALTGVASASLICGAVQMRHFGIQDQSFRLAKHWAVLPHTSAHPGAVVVQSRRGSDSAGHPGGHVSRIVSMRGNCRAVVSDSRGTYERDICSRLIAYVDPNGSQVARHEKTERRVRIARHSTRTFSAKRHRYTHRERTIAFVPIDRLSVH